jgi:nucleotide-binding universal stress UspA family protein
LEVLVQFAGMKYTAPRLQTLLCPVDFSSASLRALDLAIEVADMHGARIHVLHVIPRIVASVLDTPIATSRWTREQEKQAERKLPSLTQRAAGRGVKAKAEVRLGDIDLQILKAASAAGADLMVMGTHGRRGLERWVIGSVAERMVRHSPIPLLLTAAAPKGARSWAIRQVLIPTDFSAGTDEAIRYGIALAGPAGASITMLHIIEDRSGAVDWKTLPEQTAAIQNKLKGLVPSGVNTLVESGEPYRVILKTVKDSSASLVIMNTHGQGFVERVLVGSTADRVVRGVVAMCPILLIPPRGRASPKRS